jgi:Flp pilus assembly CpaF family ATPase
LITKSIVAVHRSLHAAHYHLRKVLTKLGIESRTQIDRVLPYLTDCKVGATFRCRRRRTCKVRGGAMEMIDRVAERDTVNQFVAAVRAGQSQALVVSGEAGVGKTALLDYLAGNASDCRLARGGCAIRDGIGFRRTESAVRAHAGGPAAFTAAAA